MFYPWVIGFLLSALWSLQGCHEIPTTIQQDAGPVPAAYDMGAYLPLLKDKSVGLVVNHTSFVGSQHLLDTLLSKDVDVKAVFAPEHGFRGEASAGANIEDEKDPDTGVRILSIYGKNKKPTPEQLNGIDIVVFDIQDVGARFYTYISTLEYVMEACADLNIPVLILDRPNPNGHYVDGPVLDLKYRSFVGRQAIPIVHGMTVGEYANMLNGEGWLKDGAQCKLTVVPCKQYSHDSSYDLPIQPSPNLPNQRSIYLYPSLCLLEGSVASLGRGTDKQFQVILHPDYPVKQFSMTPTPRPGAQYPKHKNQMSYGLDLSSLNIDELRNHKRLNLNYLLDTYHALDLGQSFFLENNFINLLAGNDQLQKDIIAGKTAKEIRNSWKPAIKEFLQIRAQYLLYPDAKQIYID